MSDPVVSFDASCECGDRIIGAWSGEACDEWAETHDCPVRDLEATDD